ncbi:MAG: nicotinamide riboside transporter PnuC [Prevotellaceae bacterium]|jgi:nicotinamide mononucleotide transporter|nr:nicotinamide riboside transporter PnuC [Prevotellaceae bacterium]
MEDILFTLGNCPVSTGSFIEAIAVIITFLCIVCAVKEKIWTFPLGMAGTALYFFVFFTQRVYSSMALQIVFFAFNAYGLYKWTHPDKQEVTKSDNTLAVTLLTLKNRILVVAIIAILTLALGYVMSNIDTWLPSLFPEKAKYVYIDTFILSASIVAQYLMALKKLENWAIWLIVDILSTPFYAITVGWATGILYFVFVFTAISGLIEWKKSYKAVK